MPRICPQKRVFGALAPVYSPLHSSHAKSLLDASNRLSARLGYPSRASGASGTSGRCHEEWPSRTTGRHCPLQVAPSLQVLPIKVVLLACGDLPHPLLPAFVEMLLVAGLAQPSLPPRGRAFRHSATAPWAHVALARHALDSDSQLVGLVDYLRGGDIQKLRYYRDAVIGVRGEPSLLGPSPFVESLSHMIILHHLHKTSNRLAAECSKLGVCRHSFSTECRKLPIPCYYL